MATVKGFTAFIKKQQGQLSEYKDLLKVAKTEDLPWFVASKMVMEYTTGKTNLTAEDYSEINKLRYFYEHELED